MMDNKSDIETSNKTPPVAESANMETLNLPEKSRKKYELQYDKFMSWCQSKKVNEYSEDVLVAYFEEKSKSLKSSTLWATYSMIRTCLNVKNNIEINKFPKLMAFLKQKSVGYETKTSKTFTNEEIYKFLQEAPDADYLLKKVILIMGITGACRRDELVKMEIGDIEDKGPILLVRIPASKTRTSRVFVVVKNKEENSVDSLSICKKYFALRLKCQNENTPKRLFLRYAKGRCVNQVVGMNIIGKVPSDIAKYLKLPEHNSYTGNCFRRTSATLLMNGGGDLIQLKNHGGLKNSNVTEGYTDMSIKKEIETTEDIFSGPSTSRCADFQYSGEIKQEKNSDDEISSD